MCMYIYIYELCIQRSDFMIAMNICIGVNWDIRSILSTHSSYSCSSSSSWIISTTTALAQKRKTKTYILQIQKLKFPLYIIFCASVVSKRKLDTLTLLSVILILKKKKQNSYYVRRIFDWNVELMTQWLLFNTYASSYGLRTESILKSTIIVFRSKFVLNFTPFYLCVGIISCSAKLLILDLCFTFRIQISLVAQNQFGSLWPLYTGQNMDL